MGWQGLRTNAFRVVSVASLACGMALFLSPGPAQKPVAALPCVKLDTIWDEPKGGKRWVGATAGYCTLADLKLTDTTEGKPAGVDFSALPTINNDNWKPSVSS